MLSQDSSILEAVRELAARLDVADPGLEEVSWRDVAGASSKAYHIVPSDRAEFQPHTLILPARMKDALSVDEWRPILASTLAYRKLYSRIMRKRTPLLLIPLIVLIVLGVVLSLFIGTQLPAALMFVYFIVIIPVLRGNTRLLYQGYLQADRTAASIVGREVFLAVLRKIDSLNLPDIEKSKKPGFDSRKAVNPVPNILDRISNLEALSASASYADTLGSS